MSNDARARAMAGPPVRVPVFAASLIGVLVMAIWALAAPTSAESALGSGHWSRMSFTKRSVSRLRRKDR